MNILKEDINREIDRIKSNISNDNLLTEEDLRIILLSVLHEEDLHESKS